MATGSRTAVVLLVPLVLVAGCSGPGPAEITDGNYAFLASSTTPGSSDGGRPEVGTLTVAGRVLTLSQPSGTSTHQVGDAAGTTVLCPPSGQGAPLRLTGPMVVGGLTLASPAVFGPCSTTSPRRITVIDLASFDDSRAPNKYGSFVEFCDQTDPDC